jgi:hypothetical protein
MLVCGNRLKVAAGLAPGATETGCQGVAQPQSSAGQPRFDGRGQLREEFNVLTFVKDGLLTGPGGKAFGSAGFSINCPIVQRLD